MEKPIQIIRISERKIDNQVTQTVNSRELWQELGSDKRYADWIKYQIESLGLEQNLDFGVFPKKVKNPQGGRPETDYIISIDAAKHIAMASRTKKGKEVRKYFIEMEKYARAQIDKQLSRLKNQDEVYHTVMNCQTLIFKNENEQKIYNEKLVNSFLPIYENHKELDEFLRYSNLFIKGVENQQVKEILTDIYKSIKSSFEKSKDLLNDFVKIHTTESDYFSNKINLYKKQFKTEK